MLPSLTDAEVKEAMKKNEDKMTIRFHTCLILIKDIERIVKDAIDVWKGIYHLHKQSEEPIEIKDDDNDQEDDEDDSTPSMTMNVTDEDLEELMKEKEDEEKEDEVEEEEKDEEDPIKIAVAVIVSLPHSPPTTVTSSRLESASIGLIASTSYLSSAPATS